MRLQGAIFDMDGTLLDSMPAWYDLTTGILREEMGLPPDEELEHIIQTGDLQQGSELLLSRYGVSCTPAEMTAMGDARMERFYREKVVPKPDAEKLLSILKMEGVWMYVATATNRPLAEAGLRRTGLDRYFRGICGRLHGQSHPGHSDRGHGSQRPARRVAGGTGGRPGGGLCAFPG